MIIFFKKIVTSGAKNLHELSCVMPTYCLIFSASALPPKDQLRHVCEFSEVSDDMPARNSASSNHSLPPRLISGGLPPIPAKLVKRIQDGRNGGASGRESDLTAVHNRQPVST